MGIFNRTKARRVVIKTAELPRLSQDLQSGSLTYISGVPIETNWLSDSHGRLDSEYIQVVLAGWQVDTLLAKLPRRTLEDEYGGL